MVVSDDRTDSAPVRAEIVPASDGMALLARCRPGAFAGSLPWIEAAHRTLGADRLLHVKLSDALDGTELGCLTLAQDRADWRSGSPGRIAWTWPLMAIGYGFGPRWLGRHSAVDWPLAVQRVLPHARLELRRSAVAAAPDTSGDFVASEGIGTWRCEQPGTVEAWLASLVGKHRRDLHKYRRDIATAGGEWIDSERDDPTLLDAGFALHRERLDQKGARSAYFAPDVEAFLRALATATAGRGLRLSLLACDGRFVASCLSFVHERQFLAFVSGWQRARSRLDLGRQVLFHQLLRELPNGLDAIDFLGGDLAYKREFGLTKQPTRDLVCHGGAFAALRARVVSGAIGIARHTRRRLAGVR
jgi:CelD/BcsL family acetyltransferase involved in cellulose biosynthesis